MELSRISLIPESGTPLQYLDSLSTYLGGPKIFLKREDLNGCLTLAGNKLRKLEYLLSDALDRNCNVIVTTGGLQSNHARTTVAAARKLGLQTVLVLVGEQPKEPLEGNLLLDYLLGAELRFTGSSDFSMMEANIEETLRDLENRGDRPYYIPLGASNPLGTMGFVSACRELETQLTKSEIEATWQVVAVGSGGTLAGLVVGSGINQIIKNTLGISVLFESAIIKPKVQELVLQTKLLAGLQLDTEQIQRNINISDAFIGQGYGIATKECLAAIKLLAKTEGIILDPTYTGKAMAGLLEYIRAGIIGSKDTVIFWHTGGLPGLLASKAFVYNNYVQTQNGKMQ